jgi:CelD/BcsL family acetyltransferase involved in cellulose biosynthesis
MRLAAIQSLREPDVGAWRELARRATEPNPFFEPDFVLPAAKFMNATSPHILVQERDGDWIGCVPVDVTRLLGKRMALSTWKHPYAYMGTPLVASGCLDEFAQALADRLAGWRHNRFMTLRRAADGGVIKAIRSAVRESAAVDVIAEQREVRPAVKRCDDPGRHLREMKPRRRRELERRRERLAEALGGELTVADRSADPTAVETFLELEASGWKGQAGTAMAVKGDGAWFRAICQNFAGRDRLQLLALESKHQVVAMHCNISANDALFNFKIAFDERFKRYAPGIQLELDAIRIFEETREERLMDSCAEPNNELIGRLWRDRQQITTFVVGPQGPSRHLVRSAIYGVRTARAGRRSLEARLAARRPS